MFISPAFAAETAAAGDTATGGASMMSLLPILLIMLVFYFMVIRPQTARMADHRKMVKDLKKGDKVVTGGGVIATVVKNDAEDEITLKIADGIEVTALRSTIMMLRTPPGQKPAGAKK